MKYTVLLTGYELNIQAKSLTNDEVEVAEWDIADMWELEEMHLAGEGDYETCALRYDNPLTITVQDEAGNEVLKLNYTDLRHYTEVDEFSDHNWDKTICINPQYADSYENCILLEKGYKGSAFYYSLESENAPKKEDFLLASLCIETADGDYDLVGEILFNGEILEEDELQSGTQQMSAMFIYKADGDQTEIS